MMSILLGKITTTLFPSPVQQQLFSQLVNSCTEREHCREEQIEIDVLHTAGLSQSAPVGLSV